jgi:hypothetical protein
VRRFLEGADRINSDHSDAHVLRGHDDCGHKHYVDGYDFADDGHGYSHVL